MDERKAVEIWEHIDSHQDQTYMEIAKALDITEACASQCSMMWAIKVRGEFIYWLTKQDNICQPNATA